MINYTKLIKNTLIVILVLLISYFGGGKEYVDTFGELVGNKIAALITREEPNEETTNELIGRIVHVSDGDTVILEDNDSKQHKIRLNGIDAPEIGQSFGEESKNWLIKQTKNKFVKIKIVDTDQYDRILGVLYVDEINVNENLLRNGLAWKYRFNEDSKYKRLVKEAQAQELNIWSELDPMDPYIWRKQNKR